MERMTLYNALKIGKEQGLRSVLEATYFVEKNYSDDEFKSLMLDWEIWKGYPLFTFTPLDTIEDVMNYFDKFHEDKEPVQSKYDIQCEAIDRFAAMLMEHFYIDPDDRGLRNMDIVTLLVIFKKKLKEEEESDDK